MIVLETNVWFIKDNIASYVRNADRNLYEHTMMFQRLLIISIIW